MGALYMVFDVESIGLHGEGYAIGAVVTNETGKELLSYREACNPDAAIGSMEGRRWVQENAPAIPYDHTCTSSLRESFWSLYLTQKDQGAILVADCAWPVEARFLAACVDDTPLRRQLEGPYPLHDVASARLAAGFDPLETAERLPNELPQHDPLADARQSARLWLEALRR